MENWANEEAFLATKGTFLMEVLKASCFPENRSSTEHRGGNSSERDHSISAGVSKKEHRATSEKEGKGEALGGKD